ncbi:MAG: RsmF rRNA methyltransferase first C-terminal domain-containing protein [Erysipelotrichaceae bacterium]|nr:RsmF rRNA methyltransferase first C-terminal domain-containing protein [Erysipelotrichaceae bacterium]
MNKDYQTYIQELLGPRYDDYCQSLEQPFHQGFRINTLKIDPQTFFAYYPLACKPSPFAKNAYVMDKVTSLGNSIFHKQGLIYVQEASAASVVDLLDIQKGDKVLDMCSAPGGKATQIAQNLDNTGLLVANEIENARAIKLLSNIERWGINNCIITNDQPAKIAKCFRGFFDRILVDAPCSGEGMFKKSDIAIQDWSLAHVNACANRQLQILEEAYQCLKQSGTLVYSTCTLNRIENEGVIERFILAHPDMELVKIDVSWGEAGFVTSIDTSKCRRIWPMDDAEGHFMAKLVKKGPSDSVHLNWPKSVVSKEAMSFLAQHWDQQPKYVYQNKDKIYAGNQPFYELKGLKVIRNQVLCGEMIKGRFEPHQHFYTAVGFNKTKTNNCLKPVELDEADTINYFKGNTLNIADHKGYVALCHHQINIGFAKGDGKILKNKYPKGLRLF